MKLSKPAGKRAKTSFPLRKSSSPVALLLHKDCDFFHRKLWFTLHLRQSVRVTLFKYDSHFPQTHPDLHCRFSRPSNAHMSHCLEQLYVCGLSLSLSLSLPPPPPPPSSNERHLSVSSSPLTLTQSPSVLLCAGPGCCQSSLHLEFIVFGRT